MLDEGVAMMRAHELEPNVDVRAKMSEMICLILRYSLHKKVMVTDNNPPVTIELKSNKKLRSHVHKVPCVA